MAVTAARVITTPSNPPNCRPSRVSHKQEEQISACPINLLWVLHTVKLGFAVVTSIWLSHTVQMVALQQSQLGS